MTKKQIAMLAAAALTAIAGLLSQCPEDPPARSGETVPVDGDAGSIHVGE